MRYSPLLFALFLISCSGKNAQPIKNADILGSWQLNTYQINYPEIVFSNDSAATFKSRGDTVYSFKFFIKNDSLFLIDIYNNIFNAKIAKLNSDSLYFETLLTNNRPQRYYRSKSGSAQK